MTLVTTALNVIESAVRFDVEHVTKITNKASRDSAIKRRRGQAQIEDRLVASRLGCTAFAE